jgi:hypothetical protein
MGLGGAREGGLRSSPEEEAATFGRRRRTRAARSARFGGVERFHI